MRYMGNKRAVLDFILPLLKEKVDRGDVVLDLFAGTGAIAYAFKPTNIVFANDIQQYSCVVTRALLQKNLPVSSVLRAREELQDNYHKNASELGETFAAGVETEAEFLLKRGAQRTCEHYRVFTENYPYYTGPLRGRIYPTEMISRFSEVEISQHRQAPATFPFLLFSTYYGNSYFGVRQCIEIDSLRYSIEQVKDEGKRDFYLTALIAAMSNAVSSPGHFAEFRAVNSRESWKDLIEERKKSILELFYDKVEELIDNFVEAPDFGQSNKCYSMDYSDLLETQREDLSEVSLVYADPPYSSAHYSRFYHVLETIVRYDYPLIDFVGRYRHDRPSSDFCRYSAVEEAFLRLGKLTSSMNSELAVSYSTQGMIPIERIRTLIGHYFRNSVVYSTPYYHSRQGRVSRMAVEENVIIFSDPIHGSES
jgi:adenine-specific DNA methylase